MKIIITANSAWNIVNFRSAIVESLLRDGHEVVILAPDDKSLDCLCSLGARHRPVVIDNKGTAPLRDIKLFGDFRHVFSEEKPDVILSYTIKNNIYGGLAARTLNVPFLPNVSGLGTVFLGAGWLERVATRLYRHAFANLPRVIFQNSDDRDLFVERGTITREQSLLVPGSGVDLCRFQFEHLPNSTDESLTFLLIARLLRDKGIHEFIDAARLVRKKYPDTCFQLLGETGVENRTAISRQQVNNWVHEGVVKYLGATEDVRPLIKKADCVVLPSYREGTPRSLLEAAAMGRPLVATDVPGCREVVADTVNGFLCQNKDAASLSEKLIQMIEIGQGRRRQLGVAGRKKMEQEFDQQIVVNTYRSAIDGLI